MFSYVEEVAAFIAKYYHAGAYHPRKAFAVSATQVA